MHQSVVLKKFDFNTYFYLKIWTIFFPYLIKTIQTFQEYAMASRLFEYDALLGLV